MTDNGKLCGDADMRQLVTLANTDPGAAVAAIDALLGHFPEDARLHFLKGSMLVGLKRFIGAHTALSNAVRLDPDFQIARFQLGFFELTSGEADNAIATWAPLKVLPERHWIRHFVDGLEHLAADRFEACIEDLRAGIAANSENLPLNGDMQLIIGKCEELLDKAGVARGEVGGAVSATSFLLGNTGGRRRH